MLHLPRGNSRPRIRKAFAGLFAALQMFVVLTVAAPMLAPQQAQAFTCFLPTECVDPNTVGADGCDKEHCWERDTRCPQGGGLCFSNTPPIPLAIQIGDQRYAINLAQYIKTIFNYGLGLAALFASVMFMIGGFQVLTAGDSDRVAKGKKRIIDSIVGLILLLLAQTLLRTINPDLVNLRMPRIEITRKKVFASCSFTETCFPCGVPYNVLIDKDGKTANASGLCKQYTLAKGAALPAGYQLGPECMGRGCGAQQVPSTGGEPICSDASFRCTIAGPGETFMCGHPPTNAIAGTGAEGGYICKTCKAEGATCGALGANDECCGGFCSDTATGHKCSSGEPGDACDDNSECRTGICQTNWGNSCSAGEIGSPCASNSECSNGNKCQTSGSNTCSPGNQFSYCDDDAECKSGFCLKLSGYENICMPQGTTLQSFKQSQCPVTGVFNDDCCNSNADCSGRGGYCNTEAYNFCTDGSPGSPCGNDNECATGICADDVCTTGDLGAKCEFDSDCRLGGQQGHCFKSGDFGMCVSGGKGSRCDDARDCGEGLKCDQNRCV